MPSPLFSLDRFKSDADVNFILAFPIMPLISIFEFLNPGEDCENIRSRIGSDVAEEFAEEFVHLGKKRHSFYIAKTAIRRVVWLRFISST